MPPFARLISLAVPALLLLGCAHSGPRFDRAANLERAAADPWEYSNRQMFDLNETVDKHAFRPVAQGYRTVLPSQVRRGVYNIMSTAGEPGHAFNATLQGKPKRAFRAFDRFVINTLFGLGIADAATHLGLERQPNDFGQTLAVWGVSSGPYFMMPLLGPSTARDSVGFLLDFVLDPLNLVEWAYLETWQSRMKLGVRILDQRASLIDQGEQLLTGVADEYATIRSAWLQMRRYQLYDGDPPPLPYLEEDEIEPYPDDLPEPELGGPDDSSPPQAEQVGAQ